MLQVEYVVHTIITTTLPVSVDYNGQSMQATIKCLEVELMPSNRGSSPILQFVGEEYAPAKEFFKEGQKIVWPLS